MQDPKERPRDQNQPRGLDEGSSGASRRQRTDIGQAAIDRAGIQTGRRCISPTHSYRAGGKPMTPISRTSPVCTSTCPPSASTAATNESLSIVPSCRKSTLLTEKQNLDM